jgi:IclR family acetate operon transcriptional repressor
MLASAPGGISVADLARNLRIGAAAASRILQTLADENVARRDATSGGYYIHPLFWLRMNRTLHAAFSYTKMARRTLDECARITSMTVCLVAPDEAGTVCGVVDYARPDRPISYHPGHMLPMPLHATASGKCYLAHQPDNTIAEYIARGLEAVTGNTITCPDRLARELAAARERGYAVSQEESVAGVCGIAVPVVDAKGDTIACLSLCPLMDEWTDARVSEWASALHQYAYAISIHLSGADTDVVPALIGAPSGPPLPPRHLRDS